MLPGNSLFGQGQNGSEDTTFYSDSSSWVSFMALTLEVFLIVNGIKNEMNIKWDEMWNEV